MYCKQPFTFISMCCMPFFHFHLNPGQVFYFRRLLFLTAFNSLATHFTCRNFSALFTFDKQTEDVESGIVFNPGWLLFFIHYVD